MRRWAHLGAGAHVRKSTRNPSIYLTEQGEQMNKTGGAAANGSGQTEWTEQEKALIAAGQQRIKSSMPEVYKTIQRHAEKDARVWRLVRMGLAGRPGCFWATEAGQVAGTPFTKLSRMVEVSRLISRMGCAHVCIIAGHGDLGAN